MRSRGRDRKPLLLNLALSLTVSVVLLGGLEAVCRFQEPPPPRATPVEGELWSPEGGDHYYTLKPHALGWPPADVNADGVRDRAHPRAKPEETARVVFLGDSVTEGFGGKSEDAYPRLLQARLDEEGQRIEVLSVAVQGWSTRQQRIAYHRIARRYQPDVVVVAACLNDVVELEHQLRPPPPALAWLHARSALVRRVVGARYRELRDVQELFRDGATYDVFFAELRRLRDEVRADGGAFAVLVFPYRFQAEPGAPPPRVQQATLTFCAREGMACHDLLPALRSLGPQAFVDDNHLSALGGQRVADEVATAGLLPARSFVPALLERLPTVRAWIEEGRPRPAPPAVAAALVKGLADRESRVRAAAAWALEGIGPAEPLARLLRDPHEYVRAAAARVLASLGPAARVAEPALFAALADEREVVRWEAARALARLGVPSRERVPDLVRALASPDAYVRNFAAFTLGEMGEGGTPAVAALVEMLAQEEGYDLKGAAEAVRKLGPAVRPAVPGLIARLGDASPEGRAKAALTLAKIGPEAAEAVPALQRALADGDRRVRANAAFALGSLGTSAPDLIASLLGRLHDPEPWVRSEAARALGKIAPAGDSPVLALTAALADRDQQVRVQAARALGRLGSGRPKVIEALDRATRDPDERVQREARLALDRMKPAP